MQTGSLSRAASSHVLPPSGSTAAAANSVNSTAAGAGTGMYRHDFIAFGASAKNKTGVAVLAEWLEDVIPRHPRTARLARIAAANVVDD